MQEKQTENLFMSQAMEGIFASRDNSYWKRMLLIQRWRRIAWLVCLFLISWAILFGLLDPEFQNPSVVMLIKSIFAFIVAIVAAVNLLTFRLR